MGNISDQMQNVKAQADIAEYAEQHLKRARSGGKYACPLCHSGDHGSAGSDSALSINKRTGAWKCFSCGEGGDIYDLAAAVEGIDKSDKRGQLDAVARWAGIALAANPQSQTTARKPAQKDAKQAETARKLAMGRERAREYIAACQAELDGAGDYLAERGYTVDEARRAGCGWDKAKQAVVFDFQATYPYWQTRNANPNATHKSDKPKAEECGRQPLMWPANLRKQACFVVEGQFDALAIASYGLPAVAIGGAGGVRLVPDACQALAQKPVLLLALDRDEAGAKATESLAQLCEQAHLPCRRVEFGGLAGKDPDEMRFADRNALGAVLRHVFNEAVNEHIKEQEQAYSAALARLAVKPTQGICENILLQAGFTAPTPTGFTALDEALGGGLPAGLTTIGAISSMGKTTLALQMADAIAKGGAPVLFVTIEQSAQELVAKSASRYMRLLDDGRGLAASGAEVLNPKRRDAWGFEKTLLLTEALEAYQADTKENMHLMEGVKQPSVADVAAAARSIAEHEGRAPAVFVDYLQLLAPDSERDSDKQAVDKNVMALRQLARDLKSPVVVISSLNRSSYSGVIDLDSFKESGAIEYGSDVLLGLQPARMAQSIEGEATEQKRAAAADKLIKQTKAKPNREVEIVVLKNRNGAVPTDGVQFVYEAKFNLLTPC